MTESAPQPTIFPAGVSTTGYAWTHPVTGQTYVYGGTTKRSWRLVGDVETRLYTGSSSPQNENLRFGDLWWDTEYLELRVYHQIPLGKSPGGDDAYTEGVWISSTHPMMDPDDPNKMKQFGVIVTTPTDRIVTEGSEFKFFAHLPHNTVPYDEWEVSATVSPRYIGSDPSQPATENKIYINFDQETGDINGNLVTGLYPIGNTADDTRRVRVTITVKAREGEEDEFYENFYQTSTKGGFEADIAQLPSFAPFVIDTLPFNEVALDTIKDHVSDITEWENLGENGDKYEKQANKTTRFVHVDPSERGLLKIVSRIDGAIGYYDDVQYPKFDELPRPALDLKTSQAKDITLLFKYGLRADESLAGKYNSVSDDYGVVDNQWQGEFEALANVEELMRKFRLTFYYDGEDGENNGLDTENNRWRRKFTDMGIVTQLQYEDNIISGQFIGLRLVPDTINNLSENNDGTRRLYFALVDSTADQQYNDVRDIIPTSKGYIDIQPLTS